MSDTQKNAYLRLRAHSILSPEMAKFFALNRRFRPAVNPRMLPAVIYRPAFVSAPVSVAA